jgi:hypothetical protein
MLNHDASPLRSSWRMHRMTLAFCQITTYNIDTQGARALSSSRTWPALEMQAAGGLDPGRALHLEIGTKDQTMATRCK